MRGASGIPTCFTMFCIIHNDKRYFDCIHHIQHDHYTVLFWLLVLSLTFYSKDHVCILQNHRWVVFWNPNCILERDFSLSNVTSNLLLILGPCESYLEGVLDDIMSDIQVACFLVTKPYKHIWSRHQQSQRCSMFYKLTALITSISGFDHCWSNIPGDSL